MIAAAEKTVGICGRPNIMIPNSTEAWCSEAVLYWAKQSGNFAAVEFNTNYTSNTKLRARYQQEGRYHAGGDGIQAGDIIFFDDHVGLVVGVSGTTVNTIEGNVSDCVKRMTRRAGSFLGYGRPAY